MNKLGFGFLRLPMTDGAIDYEILNQMVDAYLAGGGNYFDTAYTYLDGKSEEAICQALVKRHPREAFRLATKLPGYRAESYEDCFRFFEESAKRCGVEYFDVYMLHWLNETHYRMAQERNQFAFLQELKRTGKAKQIGFSFHDTAELLDRILTEHPEVDCVLLQINYLDWDSPAIQSRLCYETALRHGKAVLVMEPAKGGKLAKIPEEAEALLKQMDPDIHPASHAIRFVKDLPGVDIVLSGMNSLAQITDNLQDRPKMTDGEREIFRQAADVIRKATAVPCTGCGYCLNACPQGVAIPDCFALYNEYNIYPRHKWKIVPAYNLLEGKASSCVDCRCCAGCCPQNIDIPENLKTVAQALE